MAQVTLDLGTAAQTNRVIDAICGLYDYQPQVADPANPGQTIANPETKAQFAKRQIIEFVRNSVVAWETRQAHAAVQPPAAPTVN